MDIVMQFLESIFPMSKPLQEKLILLMKPLTLPKYQYALKAGEVCRNIYFIKKGLLRCYYVKDDNRVEVSAWFMREGDTLVSVDSFYDQVPSDEFIQALEDCELVYITFDELETLFCDYMEFNYIGRMLTQKYLRKWTRQLKNIRMMSSAERYEELLDKEPELIQRVPLRFLASYLNMTPETLSRMRNQSAS